MKKKIIPISLILIGISGIVSTSVLLTSCKSNNDVNENPSIDDNTPVLPDDPNDSNNNDNNDGAKLNFDYFILPNVDETNISNRITNPFTKNDEVIKKYGSAPLPWKDEISKDDIINMFTYLCLAWKGITVNFGERKIDSNLFNDAFVEWCSKYHKYFPYKCFDNPVPVFKVRNDKKTLVFPGEFTYETLNTDEYINNTQWYIYELDWSNYEDIYQEGENRDYYLDFINRFFRCIQPNMTDVEKFYMCAGFMANWIKYCGNMYGPSYNENGCCADYANMYSFALQLLDIPAFPVACGYQGGAGAHEIVWVQLDLDGNGEKKWYATDLTWGDSDFLPYKGLLATDPWYDSKAWLLFDVAVDQFTTINSLTPGEKLYQQDISNNLFGSPWKTIGSNTSTIGKISYGTETNYTSKYFNYFTNKRGILDKSRNFYINGYTYYFQKNPYSSNGISLYKVKATKSSSPQEINIGLPKEYLNKFYFSNKGDYPPLLQQYGNKIFLLLNPEKSINSEYHRTILAINFDQENGIQWEQCKEFELPTSINNKYIYNFDIELDGTLRVDYGNDIYSSMDTEYFDLGQEFKNIATFNIENNNRPEDLNIAKNYFSALISMFRNGNNKDGFLSFQKRKEFYDFMDNQSEKNPFVSINNIYRKYIEIISTLNVSSGRLIYNRMLDDLYFKEEIGFKNFGFDFGNFRLFNNPVDMIGVSEVSTKFNIYYSPTKPNTIGDLDKFTKVVSEINRPYITINDLNDHGFSSGSGFYYIEIDKNGVKTNTNVCELKLTDNISNLVETQLHYYSDSEPNNTFSKITNFDETIYNWDSSKINFNFEIYLNHDLFSKNYEIYSMQLKHYNISNNISEVIISTDDFLNKYYDIRKNAYRGKISLDLPNENNHGIYYLEVISRNIYTNQLIESYSDFNFILSMNDYDNWNKDLWIDSINNILEKRL